MAEVGLTVEWLLCINGQGFEFLFTMLSTWSKINLWQQELLELIDSCPCSLLVTLICQGWVNETLRSLMKLG